MAKYTRAIVIVTLVTIVALAMGACSSTPAAPAPAAPTAATRGCFTSRACPRTRGDDGACRSFTRRGPVRTGRKT